MADESPQMRLQQEVTCSICLDYFTDPYTVDCGHHFCRVCISRYLEDSAVEGTCPQCRARIQPRNFTPNRDLVRFVEISKQMSCRRDWEAGRWEMCPLHQEPLRYFCKNDQVCLCSVCDRSEQHENHDTVPVEVAALELKELVYSCLDHVRLQRDKVSDFRNNTEEEHHQVRLKIAEGKEKMTNAFIVMREFLTDAELLLSNEMSKVENEYGRTMEENLSLASEKLSFFEHILENMAEMCRLPEGEILQNGGRRLQRWVRERFDKPVEYPPALKWRMWELCDLRNFMEMSVKRMQVLFDAGFQLRYDKANVTFDPSTAHPKLGVSEDFKTVTWVHGDQAVPDNPRRFDVCPCVLGSEGFNSGKVYWEVCVGTEGSWAFGVAKESLNCKGEVALSSEKGIYAIGKCADRYFAFERMNFAFPWRPLKPMRIRVILDYIGGSVVFADADQAAELFEFRVESFYNEKLYPFFWIQKEGQFKIHS